MKKILFAVLLILGFQVKAQLIKSIEFDIIGQPSWDLTVPTNDNGLIYIAKTDLTKVFIAKYSSDLEIEWKNEFFIDAEKPPTAYTIYDTYASFLFNETSGMYYQVIDFQLNDGKIGYHGFELRDYFVDQDYISLSGEIMMAGKNEKGGAFFKANLTTKEGKLFSNEIKGNDVNVQHFEYLPFKNKIISLWAVKLTGYTNEKKKKGAFTKSSHLEYAEFDTTGKLISKIDILPQKGYFPLTGKLVQLPSNQKVVVGTYQASNKDKGVFFVNLAAPNEITFKSFASILNAPNPLSEKDYQALLEQFSFLPIEAVGTAEQVSFGGVFYKADIKTVSSNDNSYYNSMYPRSYYDPYGYNRNFQRTQTRQVFNGYMYPLGFIIRFDLTGEVIQQQKIELNQTSPQVQQTLSANQNGNIAYCLNGTIGVKNLNISTKPLVYKLTNDKVTAGKSPNFLPSYHQVKFWYGNYFIALGSKTKMEAASLSDTPKSKPKKTLLGKKKPTPSTEIQIRKTVYLTKIASGEGN